MSSRWGKLRFVVFDWGIEVFLLGSLFLRVLLLGGRGRFVVYGGLIFGLGEVFLGSSSFYLAFRCFGALVLLGSYGLMRCSSALGVVRECF